MVSNATPAAGHLCRPLIVTEDPPLVDELAAIAASVGTEIDVVPGRAGLDRRCATAPIVLVGVDQAEALAGTLPRRRGVVVVCLETQQRPPWTAADAVGAEHVVVLPTARAWLAERLKGTGNTCVTGGSVLAVIGGCGGAGTSTLAAALAVTAARNRLRTLLIDADPLGGGADLALGWEGRAGIRWSALLQTSGQIDPAALATALPHHQELAVLACDRGAPADLPAAAMESVLDAAVAAGHTVVLDLPRSRNEATAVAVRAADLAAMVVPTELRACAGAARVLAHLDDLASKAGLVVRASGSGRLKPREMSHALDLPVIGTFRPESEIARGLERGVPPADTGTGPLAVVCERILASITRTGRPSS